MQTIKGLFQKYAHLAPPESSKKKVVVQAVKKECGITLSEDDVRLSSGGVFLGCHPIERAEILRSAPQVLTRLRDDYSVYMSFIR
jgi:hypothetical protein